MPTTNSSIQFKHGLQETFSNITKDSNTIYFITDTNRLFVGDSEYTRPVQHGSELPTSKNPANSLFVKETGTSRELYYSKDGTAWDMIAYLPATITGGVFGDNTAGTVAYGGTVKVPKVTVDNRGYVTAAEDVTLTLPASDKVTTVTTSGDGNAVTGGSISNDGATLTLTKGESFVPVSGGTFSGDVVVTGDLTTGSITPINNHNIEIQTSLTEEYYSDPDYYYATLNFKDTSENAVSNVAACIRGGYFPDETKGRGSTLNLDADNISLTGNHIDLYGGYGTDGISIYANTSIYGKISCASNPSESSHLTNKSYVDNAIASALSASDAMVFKGTVGTSGTVASISVMDYSTAATGDTYKVITTDTLPAANSSDSSEHDLTPGDLIVYMGESKFIYVPSGDEDVTSIKVAGSGDTINVSTTAQTGTVVLGDAATKKASTSTTLNGNGASNDNVPTELAVKTYVDDTVGALENTLGTAAATNATDYATAAQGTKADNAMPKSGGTFTGDVTVSGDLTADNIRTSGEITITPNTDVDITTHEQEHDNSKITFVNTNQVNDNPPISIESVYEATVYGHYHAYDTSILKLNADRTEINGNQGLYVNTINTLDIANEYSFSESPFREIDSVILKKTLNGATPASIKFTMIDSGRTSSELELNANNINFNGTVTLTNTPTSDFHAATKKYVDDSVSGVTDTKVTTVTTTGDGNAVTGGSISADGTTLTLTKGTSFVPSTGGTFSGDITVSGNLTADDIKTSGEINITPNDNETTVDVQFLNGGDSFDNDTTVSIESEYVPHSPAPGVPANSNKTYLKLNSDVTQINSDTTEITGALNVSGQINGLDIESENQNNVYTRTISDIGVSAYVEFERANGDHNLKLNADNNIDLDASNINLNGNVTLSSVPSNNMHAATKKYVDDAVTAATLTWKTL